jgi:tRNA 2-selenouridine synthase
MRLAFPTISARELCARPDARVIDLRSPGEFAEDHVPGAVNVPLFDDVQRALVGTLYVRNSPDEAFRAAREIVRAHIGELVSRISAATGWHPAAADLEGRVDALTADGIERVSSFLMGAESKAPPANPVVFHCWRGGLRSRSVLHFVRELGLGEATLLDGGYKGYRAEVVRQVVDLEALAGHRSSLLGMVGLAPCTQKTFESRLAARMRQPIGAALIVEGESRKVGDVTIPPRLWAAMESATNVELVAGVERRVVVLSEDYLAEPRALEELRRQLPLVEARMPKKHVGPGLVALLDAGRTDELVRLLLEHYYDPLYRHSEKKKTYAARIDATDPRAAAQACLRFVAGREALRHAPA